MKLIDKDNVVAEIERIKKEECSTDSYEGRCKLLWFEQFLSFLNTLEVKEVDLEKLGEIARHLIAVKNHIEDMRLDNDEWLLLEKLGYTENIKAQKGE